MFTYKTSIRLHHTDAAGLIFFANQLVLAHDAYESLLKKMGFNYENHLLKGKYLLPIVHVESDYKRPLFVGDEISIRVKVARIGTTSFTLEYQFYKKQKLLVGTVQTVHVLIEKKSKKKCPLSKALRSSLERISD